MDRHFFCAALLEFRQSKTYHDPQSPYIICMINYCWNKSRLGLTDQVTYEVVLRTSDQNYLYLTS